MNNDLFEVKIENMYGLNNTAKFEISSKAQHNFIYGINASGKSSVANSITHIINNVEYKRRMNFDKENFELAIKFDGIDISYNENKKINDVNVSGIEKKIFVFNKFYAKNNLDMGTNTGGFPEVGIRVKERNEYIGNKNDKLEEFKKELDKKIKNNDMPSKQGDYYDSSQLKNYTKTGKDKLFAFEEALLELNKSVKAVDSKVKFSHQDFFNENIKLYIDFLKMTDFITKDLLNSLKEKRKTNKYSINDVNDKNFYISVLEYLSKDKKMKICPVCLKDADIGLICDDIKSSLSEILNNNYIQTMDSIYKKMGNINSDISNLIVSIFQKLLITEYDIDDANNLRNMVTTLCDNYDYLFLKEIDMEITTTYNEIILINTEIETINKANAELKDDTFIKKFDEMLEYLFKDDDIRAESQLKNNDIIIQLRFYNNQKEGMPIQQFYTDILSESQKTKLSLAFFLAVVTYKNIIGKILCIFDDPLDSYDSISKYELSRVIHEFITKKSIFENYNYICYDLVLSHSVDYFRLFYYNFRKMKIKENNYYLLSKAGLSPIDSEKLFIIEGDYNILNNLFYKNNSSINIKEMIAMIPIIRELATYSSDNFKTRHADLQLNGLLLAELGKKLSENIIHGLFRNNITLQDLIDLLHSYIHFNLEPHIYNQNEKLHVVIKQIIESERNVNHDFYDEIVLKNIVALYVRAGYDSIVVKIIKDDIHPTKTEEEIHRMNGFEISSKIGIIFGHKDANDNRVVLNTHRNLINKISSNNTMFNEFGHSANIFLTPLIDVQLKRLFDIYDDFMSSSSGNYISVPNVIGI